METDPLDLWRRICLACDGTALIGFLGELHRRGVTDLPRSAAGLARAAAIGEGHAALCCKLLAHLGWIAPDPSGGFAPTALGTGMIAYLGDYAQAPALLAAADALLHGRETQIPPALTTHPLVRAHLEGPLIAGASLRLADGGDLASNATLRAVSVLAQAGWIIEARDGWEPTDLGHRLLPMSRQFGYVASYLPSFASLPVAFDGGSAAGTDPRCEEEQHIDRARDVAFSGEVFARSCREPFLELLRPIFDMSAIEAQPRAIVDTGCGDGTVLAASFDFIAAHTARGAALDRAPLLLVGVEMSETARRIAAARLAATGAPFLTFLGDIADPEAIAGRLAEHGIDPRAVLHISKSVFHNRRFEPPRRTRAAPPSEAVFVAPGGAAIAADDVYANLVEVLERWAACTGRHGMVMIEAHTVPTGMTALRPGLSPVIPLEAAHGLSGQLLTEAGVHRAALEEAGFQRLDSRQTGSQFAGAPLLTLERVMPLANAA